MTRTKDPVPQWTRQVAQLRTQAVKHARTSDAPCEIAENAIAACEALLRDLAGARLEGDRLQAEVRTADAAWELLFDVMPVPCLLTDSDGSIVNANRAAGVLLNLSARHLKDRKLLMFCADRDAFGSLLRELAGGERIDTTLTFRPRDRRPAQTSAVIIPLSSRASGLCLWFLTPAAESHTLQAREALDDVLTRVLADRSSEPAGRTDSGC